MNKKAIKDALRKTRYMNRQETGKKNLSKGQLIETVKNIEALEKLMGVGLPTRKESLQ